VLTMLPEITYLWVSRTVSTAEKTAGGLRSSLELDVDGMGCVACTKKVAEVLDSVPQVLQREVQLEQKRVKALLAVRAEEARDEVLPKLLQSIADAGFKAALAGIEDVDTMTPVESVEAIDQAELSCCEGSRLSIGGSAGLPLSIGAGLVSSSCCLLQLGVNLLTAMNLAHVGCAGFNKVLGPVRPQLRMLTGGWLGVSCLLHFTRRCPEKIPEDIWRKRQRTGAWRLLLRTLLCLVLTFLPEVLVWSGGPGVAPDVRSAEVLKVKVDGMGCEACQVHVQSVMDRMDGVVSSHVDFATGQAEIVINRDWNFDMTELNRRLDADGYGASPLTSPIAKGAEL